MPVDRQQHVRLLLCLKPDALGQHRRACRIIHMERASSNFPHGKRRARACASPADQPTWTRSQYTSTELLRAHVEAEMCSKGWTTCSATPATLGYAISPVARPTMGLDRRR